MKNPRSYIVISLIASVSTIVLELVGYFKTGSVSMLSDSLETIVNLIANAIGFWALSYAAQPPDPEHPFGHSKAEYFSSGIESILIILSSIFIFIEAGSRFLSPHPLEQMDLGIVLAGLSSVIYGFTSLLLFRASKNLRSITLKAAAQHLLADGYVSLGVVVGVVLVKLTGWSFIDPIIGLLIAASIIRTGIKLLQETGSELLDRALSPTEKAEIYNVFHTYEGEGISFHALRTRIAGSRSFIYFHVLVPGLWTVQQGHDLCEEIENKIMDILPGSHVMSHLEPIEDPASWDDEGLGRKL
jgi:cation diffusion facilitator family transporter